MRLVFSAGIEKFDQPNTFCTNLQPKSCKLLCTSEDAEKIQCGAVWAEKEKYRDSSLKVLNNLVWVSLLLRKTYEEVTAFTYGLLQAHKIDQGE